MEIYIINNAIISLPGGTKYSMTFTPSGTNAVIFLPIETITIILLQVGTNIIKELLFRDNCLYHKRNNSELNNKSLPKMDCTYNEFSDIFNRNNRLYIGVLINFLKLNTLCETNILLASQLYDNP